ncbi:hypothetical protein P9104_00385 [Gallibacterium anatis]
MSVSYFYFIFITKTGEKMKEININELSLVFGASPLQAIKYIGVYVAGREIVDPIYDEIRDNIVNTPIEYPLSVPIRTASPSWTEGKIRYSSEYEYTPGSSYPTKNSNKTQSGSDYCDGCNYC